MTKQQHTPDQQPQARRYTLEELERLWHVFDSTMTLYDWVNSKHPPVELFYFWLRSQEASGKVEELLKHKEV